MAILPVQSELQGKPPTATMDLGCVREGGGIEMGIIQCMALYVTAYKSPQRMVSDLTYGTEKQII